MQQYANNAETTLGASLNNSATSLTVASSTGFPSGGDFTIRIDDEFLLVTAVSGTTWTVTRAQEGSSAASHSNGAAVTMPLTKAGLEKLIVTAHGNGVVGTQRTLNFKDTASVIWTITDDSGNGRMNIEAASEASGVSSGFEAAYTTPDIDDWTQTNMGSGANIGTASQSADNIFLRDAGTTDLWLGDHCRLLYKTTGSAPWTWIVKAIPFFTGQPGQQVGVCFYDTVSTKMACFRWVRSTDGGYYVDKWTNPNTYSGAYKQFNVAANSPWTWIKLEDDNTNRKISVSRDGRNWILIHSVGRTDFLTADAVGFWANANTNNGAEPYDCGILIVSSAFS